MSTEKFSFKNSDSHTLAGRLEKPDSGIKGYAIFAHCFTCSKNVLAASRIPKRLAEHGIAVLRFDFTGLGNSEGDFSNTNFSSNVEDLVSAFYALKDKYEAPALIIGHSLGGAAALKAATQIPELKALATIGAPSDVDHIVCHFKDGLEEIEKKGEANVELAGRSFTIKKQFIDDIKGTALLKEIGKIRTPLLVMHSPLDKTVAIDHAAEIFSSAMHPKSFVSLNKADHLVTSEDDAHYIADVMSAWVRPFMSER